MQLTAYKRFESDEECPETGRYEFDGFVADGAAYLPQGDELVIALCKHDLFPSTGRPARPCYWKLVDGLLGAEPVYSPAAPVGV